MPSGDKKCSVIGGFRYFACFYNLERQYKRRSFCFSLGEMID